MCQIGGEERDTELSTELEEELSRSKTFMRQGFGGRFLFLLLDQSVHHSCQLSGSEPSAPT